MLAANLNPEAATHQAPLPSPTLSSSKTVTFKLDQPNLGSLDEQKLAEMAGSEPAAVLAALAQRLGSVYPGAPNYMARAAAILGVFERIPWSGLSDADFKTFSGLLVNLSAVCPSSISQVFRAVLADSCAKRCTRVEHLVCLLVKHIPSSTGVLIPSLEYNFPHYSRPVDHLINYTQFLIALMSSLPVLRPKILELILEKFLHIDVAIQMEATNLPEELDVLDEDVEMSSPHSEDEEEALEAIDSDLLRRSSSPIALNMADMMSKLDAGLVLVIKYFSSIKEETSEIKTCFDSLMQIFERSILPTFRSRSTPFVLFYVTSLNPSLTDVFLGFLMKRLYHVFDQPGDGKKKSAASSASLLTVVNASYIGSFVARAKFLPHRLVRLSFDMLLTWCLRFLGDLPNHLRSGVKSFRSSNEVVSEKIAVFYAVSQAVMYIFCFRHRLLMHEHEDLDAATIKANYRNFLLPILQSGLNPLKWCMSAVVEEFVRLADMYDLVDCHQIMDKSSRRSAPPMSTTSTMQNISKFDDESRSFQVSDQTGSFLGDLDSYFPFDPIMLKECSTYITEDLYIEWNNLVDSSDEADSDDDSSSDAEDIGRCNRDLLLCNPVWQGLAVRK